MEKTKVYYICDRCKKEIEDYSKEENNVCDGYNAYLYDLCKECKVDYVEYKRKIAGLDKTHKMLSEKYKFGKYLPKDNEDLERL